MPKVQRRNCDNCGVFYEKANPRYCSLRCSGEASRKASPGKMEVPVVPDEDVARREVDGELEVRVAASCKIKTVDGLLEAAEVDLAEWVVVTSDVRVYHAPMKLEKKPIVVELWYVSARLRRRDAAMLNMAPRVLKVTRPSVGKPSRGPFRSVHYSDLHIPFHDPRAVNVLYQVLDYVRPGLVADQGDTADCYEVSRYLKDPSKRVPLNGELDAVAKHHGVVHGLTPNAEHVWTLGNHEDRIRKLMWGLAESRPGLALMDVPGLKEALLWENMVGVGALGWEVIPYPRHKLLWDRLVVTHGNVVQKHAGASARAEYEKYRKCGMSGHTHRRGVYEHRDYDTVNAWWELGCMCRLDLEYAETPNWQQGFAVVTWSEDRSEFGVDEVRIHDGVAYFEGRRFEGNAASLTAEAA